MSASIVGVLAASLAITISTVEADLSQQLTRFAYPGRLLTMTGCLESGPEPDSFLLTQAIGEIPTLGQDNKVFIIDTSKDPATKGGPAYRLVPNEQTDLLTFGGQKVEIVGTAVPYGDIGKSKGRGKRKYVVKVMDLLRIKVVSIRSVALQCAPPEP